MLKSWAQSCLIGVERVVYGFRNQAGILQHTETFMVDEMPQLAREKSESLFQQPWNDSVCLNFLSAVLDWLSEEIQDGEPRALCYGGQDKSDELLLVRAPAVASQAVDNKLIEAFMCQKTADKSTETQRQKPTNQNPGPVHARRRPSE